MAFTPPASDGGAAISNYEYSTDGTTYVARSPAATNSPLTISGLNNGTTYPVTLKAVNSVGAGTASASTNGTPAAPTQPPVITATTFLGQVGVALSNAVIQASGSPTNFTLVSGTLPGGLTFNSNNGTITGTPTNAVTNDLTVTAQNSQGTSSNTTIGLAIAKGSNTITFAALPGKLVGDAAFTLSATATSGLPVSYASTNDSVATISNNTVTIVGAGTATITASQAGNENYEPAPSVNQVLNVLPLPLIGWEVTGLTNNGLSPQPPTTNSANLTITGLTRGSGVTSTSTGDVWGGTGWNGPTNTVDAVAANKFATFTIQPKTGYVVSLSQIGAHNFRRSGTGATKVQWQYSVSSGPFVNLGPEISLPIETTSGNPQAAIDLSTVSALQNVDENSSIVLRIVPHTASGASGTFYIRNLDGGVYDLAIYGAVNTAAPSAPTFTSTNAFAGTVGVAFSNTATASGTTPITFSGTNLPGGLNIASNGVISGTPTNAGSISSTLTASNSVGTTNQIVTFTIAKGTPVITAAPTGSTISTGAALTNSVLSGGSATGGGSALPGTFRWNVSTNPPVGTNSYQVVFTPTDTNNWNTALTNATVIVSADTNAPTLALINHVNPMIHRLGTAFTDPGATVTDNLDATRTVISSNNVNTARAGTYLLTYTATDAAGNAATPVTRTVVVKAGVVALDSSANYGGGWGNGVNGGTGFGAWAISNNNDDAAQRYAGSFIGDPTSAEITGMGAQAFALYANPNTNGPFVDAGRSLSNALAIGQTLSFQWAINWDSGDGGNKGFNLLVGTNEVVNVNNAASATITFNGTDVGFGYGKGVMTWAFTRTSSNNILVTVNDRDGDGSFSTNITVTNAPSAGVDGLKFYASNMQPSDQRQAYFNNLLVEAPDTNGPSLALKAGVERLTWVALSGSAAVSTNDVDVSDPSGIFSLSNSPSIVNTASNGFTTVTYTAVDGAGNTNTISRVIAVGSASPADHLVTNAATNLPTTATLTVRAKIAIPDATDGAGQAPNLQCWIGVGKVAGDPSAWAAGDVVAWVAGNYNDLLTGSQDEYTAELDLTALGMAPGNYYLVARWQIGEGPYFYSGEGGPWDADTNPSVILTVTTGAPYDLWLAGATTNNRSLAEFTMGSARPGAVPYQGTNLAVEIITNDVSGTNYLRQNYWVRHQEVNVDTNIVITPQVGSTLDGVYSNVVHNQNGRMGTIGSRITIQIAGTDVSMQRRFVEVPITGAELKRFLRIKIEKP